MTRATLSALIDGIEYRARYRAINRRTMRDYLSNIAIGPVVTMVSVFAVLYGLIEGGHCLCLIWCDTKHFHYALSDVAGPCFIVLNALMAAWVVVFLLVKHAAFRAIAERCMLACQWVVALVVAYVSWFEA